MIAIEECFGAPKTLTEKSRTSPEVLADWELGNVPPEQKWVRLEDAQQVIDGLTYHRDSINSRNQYKRRKLDTLNKNLKQFGQFLDSLSFPGVESPEFKAAKDRFNQLFLIIKESKA